MEDATRSQKGQIIWKNKLRNLELELQICEQMHTPGYIHNISLVELVLCRACMA